MKQSMTIYSMHQYFQQDRMTVPEFIEYAAGLDLDGVELGYYWLDEKTQIKDAAGWLREAGLAISGYIASSNFCLPDRAKLGEEIDKVKRAVDQASFLQTDMVRVFAGGSKGLAFDEGKNQVLDCLGECNEYAAGQGVRLALENHGGLGANSKHLLYYREALASDNFGFVVDIGNFRDSGGEDPSEGVERTADGAFLVHVKDMKPDGSGDWECCILGQGEIPVRDCLLILKDAGYDGYLSLEYEAADDCKVGIEQSFAHLRKVLAEME